MNGTEGDECFDAKTKRMKDDTDGPGLTVYSSTKTTNRADRVNACKTRKHV